MILDDYEFIDEQDSLYLNKKRGQWLIENIQTLRILLNHMDKNESHILKSYYNKYVNILSKKIYASLNIESVMKRQEEILLSSMLYYVDLPEDIKWYVGNYVDVLADN